MDMRDSIRPNGQRPSWPPKANQQPGGGPHEGQVRANSFFIFFHLMNLDKRNFTLTFCTSYKHGFHLAVTFFD